MAKKTELKLTHVNVNFPTPLVQRVKQFSLSLGVPTTQGYIILLSKALDNNDVLTELPKLMDFMKLYKDAKLSDNNVSIPEDVDHFDF